MWAISLATLGFSAMIVFIVCCFCDTRNRGIVGRRCRLFFTDGLFKWIKWRHLHLHASCLTLRLLCLGGLLLLLLLVLRCRLSRLQGFLGVLGRLVGLALLVDGNLRLVLIGRNLFLCLL